MNPKTHPTYCHYPFKAMTFKKWSKDGKRPINVTPCCMMMNPVEQEDEEPDKHYNMGLTEDVLKGKNPLEIFNSEPYEKLRNDLSNGIKNEATVSMDFISDKKIKNKFIGVKKDDLFSINVMKAFKNHTDLSAMLNITHEQLHDLSSEEFQFTVKNISKLEPAKMDKELFEKVYGKDSVKTIKEFKSKIKEEAENSYAAESDRLLMNDVVPYLINKIKFDLPDEFLKKWLVHTSEKSVTLEQIEGEYDMYSKSLRWQLIENNILESFDVKVDAKEVEDHTKTLISMQMKQYGQPVPEDDKMNEIVASILVKEDERKKVYDQLYDIKTLEVYKENFKLTEKAISYDDFVKLASEK